VKQLNTVVFIDYSDKTTGAIVTDSSL